MVPKQSSSKKYCKVCKEDFADYLQVLSRPLSTYSPPRTCRNHAAIDLVVILLNSMTAFSTRPKNGPI